MGGYDLYANQGPSILAENIVCLILANLIIWLRLYSRYISTAPLWWDDWFIVICMVLGWIMFVLACISILDYGFGRHAEAIGTENVVKYIKLYLGEEVCYLSILATAKISILFFFWRVFNRSSMKRLIYIMMTMVTLWWIGCILMVSLECRPLRALWNPSAGHCFDLRVNFLSSSIPNIVTDWLLLMMPVPYIWRLQITNWQKFGLCCAFALGSVTTVISIVRLVIAVRTFNPGPDVTWNYVKLIKWSAAELYLAPTAACFPSLGPLARKLVSKWRKRFPKKEVVVSLTTQTSYARTRAAESGTLSGGDDLKRDSVMIAGEDTWDDDYNSVLRGMNV